MVGAAVRTIADANSSAFSPLIPRVCADHGRTRVCREKVLDVRVTNRSIKLGNIYGPRHASSVEAIGTRTAAVNVVTEILECIGLSQILNTSSGDLVGFRKQPRKFSLAERGCSVR